MSLHDPQKITITICGDGGCGKSSITLRLVKSQWTSDYDPTIEDSYSLTRTIDGSTYHLSLTDTAGQEEYRGMWASSNLKSDAFLLVYDITNRDSLDCLQSFIELIDIEGDVRSESWERSHMLGSPHSPSSEKRPVKPIKIVAGNKCDLQESRQVPAQVGLKWAKERGCGFMETSARNTVNIEETFALIVRRVVEARREAWGEEARGRGMLGGGELGTRRAMTKPLSPLPGGNEKLTYPNQDMGGGEGKREGGFKRYLRKLKCW